MSEIGFSKTVFQKKNSKGPIKKITSEIVQGPIRVPYTNTRTVLMLLWSENQ